MPPKNKDAASQQKSQEPDQVVREFDDLSDNEDEAVQEVLNVEYCNTLYPDANK